MTPLISIGFPFHGNYHYVLISSRQLNNNVQYRITIMYGELEKLILDCNLIEEVNGQLQLDDCQGNIQKFELKREIVTALANHLQKEITLKYRHNN